ncbi:hypothetical protein BdWA1_003427 [Babesia duncani]|uniref:Uncharacterized protein n=1 Tax=Babesia duncani TaxID=323732 RepID=A0AAD9UMJ3_9APIC|nr:hypothetical protein BdWA1_004080 [Babesia duncani]KAK2194662.1 hypothetical protein BdWA1_003868 [Babesia duncani]KAK2194770.1 hypothetical protein BdWA1_003760 [Babesia duncani]KAK2195125.1 hypothetical protein BdWA1_003427 [Babesia duncani]
MKFIYAILVCLLANAVKTFADDSDDSNDKSPALRLISPTPPPVPKPSDGDSYIDKRSQETFDTSLKSSDLLDKAIATDKKSDFELIDLSIPKDQTPTTKDDSANAPLNKETSATANVNDAGISKDKIANKPEEKFDNQQSEKMFNDIEEHLKDLEKRSSESRKLLSIPKDKPKTDSSTGPTIVCVYGDTFNDVDSAFKCLMESAANGTPDAYKTNFKTIYSSLEASYKTKFSPVPLKPSEIEDLKFNIKQIKDSATKADGRTFYEHLKLFHHSYKNNELPEHAPEIESQSPKQSETPQSLEGSFDALMKSSVEEKNKASSNGNTNPQDPNAKVHKLPTAAITSGGKTVDTPSVTDGNTTIIKVPNSLLESKDASVITVANPDGSIPLGQIPQAMGANPQPIANPVTPNPSQPPTPTSTLQVPTNVREEIVEVKCGERIVQLKCPVVDTPNKVLNDVNKVQEAVKRVKEQVMNVDKDLESMNDKVNGYAQNTKSESKPKKHKKKGWFWSKKKKNLKKQKEEEQEESEEPESQETKQQESTEDSTTSKAEDNTDDDEDSNQE